MSAYNAIDNNTEAREESLAQTALIKLMLQSSDALKGVDFNPIYSYVATWHKSIAFPYVWYDTDTVQEVSPGHIAQLNSLYN